MNFYAKNSHSGIEVGQTRNDIRIWHVLTDRKSKIDQHIYKNLIVVLRKKLTSVKKGKKQSKRESKYKKKLIEVFF